MAGRPKLQPIDYAVMFGGPILFLLIFWIGVRLISGPVPEASPVKKLREGKIQIGDTYSEVQQELGRPNQIEELPDGSFRLVYTRTIYDEATKSDSLDEAVVEITPTGRVANIRLERLTPPASTD